MIAIAYLDENGKGFRGTNEPWIYTWENMTFCDIDEAIKHIKEIGGNEITVFQLNDNLESITWDYVNSHVVICNGYEENISILKTCDLVDELVRRDGVDVKYIESYERETIQADGPAVILVIKD